MKTRTRLAALAASVLVLGGCSSLDKEFVRSADTFAHEVGEEYLTYVGNDENLNSMQKQIRVNRVRSQQSLTQEVLNDGQ